MTIRYWIKYTLRIHVYLATYTMLACMFILIYTLYHAVHYNVSLLKSLAILMLMDNFIYYLFILMDIHWFVGFIPLHRQHWFHTRIFRALRDTYLHVWISCVTGGLYTFFMNDHSIWRTFRRFFFDNLDINRWIDEYNKMFYMIADGYYSWSAIERVVVFLQ